MCCVDKIPCSLDTGPWICQSFRGPSSKSITALPLTRCVTSAFRSQGSGLTLTLVISPSLSVQGGLLTGKDPSAYNTTDPIRLWIIQVGIIVCTTSLLSLVLKKVRQPKVIAEVLGGILLGAFVPNVFTGALLTCVILSFSGPTAFGKLPSTPPI